MSSEEMNQDQENESTTEEIVDITSGGADDGFVVPEEKQPVNRSTLVMFAILVMAAGGLYFMYRRTGPQSASAASITKETAEARKTISSFLTSGDSSFKTMEAHLKNTEKIVAQFVKYPSATQVPLDDLLTNPFRAKLEGKQVAQADPALSEAAEKKRKEEEKLAIRKAVEGLALQSIMCSDTRKACMINNTLFREGQTVNNFTIEKISPTTVDVKQGQYRYQLRIDR